MQITNWENGISQQYFLQKLRLIFKFEKAHLFFTQRKTLMKKLLCLFTLLITFLGNAQQDPVLTQFWNNYSFINPATSAMDYKHQAAVQYRDQWVSLKGAPRSLLVNYNYAINRNHAIGVNYMYETIGFNKLNVAVLNYSYKIHFSDSITHFLSFGVGIGIGNNLLDYPLWIPPSSTADIYLPTKYNVTYPKLNLGVAYRYKNLFIGFGVTQVTGSSIIRSKPYFAYKPRVNYYFMAAYDFRITENFSLKPQLLIQTDAIRVNPQMNLLATLFKNYSLGVSYHYNNAIGFVTQVDILGKFRIGYSYDYSFGPFSNASKGTHEIVLGFHLK